MKLAALLVCGICAFAADPLRVRLVTGGHAHDPEFYSAFTRDLRIIVLTGVRLQATV